MILSPLGRHVPTLTKCEGSKTKASRPHLGARFAQRESGGGAMAEMIKRLRDGEQGAMGYMLLWFLGVPASVLFVIFLMRGCT